MKIYGLVDDYSGPALLLVKVPPAALALSLNM
jgi:hypothetical protein